MIENPNNAELTVLRTLTLTDLEQRLEQIKSGREALEKMSEKHPLIPSIDQQISNHELILAEKRAAAEAAKATTEAQQTTVTGNGTEPSSVTPIAASLEPLYENAEQEQKHEPLAWAARVGQRALTDQEKATVLFHNMTWNEWYEKAITYRNAPQSPEGDAALHALGRNLRGLPVDLRRLLPREAMEIFDTRDDRDRGERGSLSGN